MFPNIEITKEYVLELLKKNTIIDELTDCWLYKGYINFQGYGQIRINWKTFLVHRLSCFLYHNLDLQNTKLWALHKIICLNKNCWNPDHLYIGDASDNASDRVSSNKNNNQHKDKTHCHKNHEYTKENTRIRSGRRICLICYEENKKKFNNRRKKKI